MSGKDEKKPHHGGGCGGKTTATVAPGTKGRGACEALGIHVFEHGQKGSADQMRNTFKEIYKHVGNLYGPKLAAEIHDRVRYVVPKPEESQATKDQYEKNVESRKKIYDARRNMNEKKIMALQSASPQDEAAIAELECLMLEAKEAHPRALTISTRLLNFSYHNAEDMEP
jgi:hypothetical protein